MNLVADRPVVLAALNAADARFDNLQGRSIRVAACILARTDPRTMSSILENDVLAADAGISRHQLRRAIAELIECNVLTVERFGTARLYQWSEGSVLEVSPSDVQGRLPQRPIRAVM